MAKEDLTEIEFVKNFKLNGEWKRVGLSKAEVKDLQIQHIKDLITLLTNVSFEVYDSKLSDRDKKKAIELIFEAVAPKNFTVIQSALDKKVLKFRESEEK